MSRAAIAAASVRRQVRTLAAAFLTAAVLGCGSTTIKTREESDTEQVQLQVIGSAYAEAIQKLKHGPKDLEEFKPFLLRRLDGDTVAAAIAGKQVIVIWGLDGGDLAPASPEKGPPRFPILAYEAKPQEGKRYVLRGTAQVEEMSDADFRNAYFPKGHKPQ